MVASDRMKRQHVHFNPYEITLSIIMNLRENIFDQNSDNWVSVVCWYFLLTLPSYFWFWKCKRNKISLQFARLNSKLYQCFICISNLIRKYAGDCEFLEWWWKVMKSRMCDETYVNMRFFGETVLFVVGIKSVILLHGNWNAKRFVHEVWSYFLVCSVSLK